MQGTHRFFEIIEAGQLHKRPKPTYVEDVEDTSNLKVALALARLSRQAQSGPVLALGFGYAGTGKSSFANALSWQTCGAKSPFFSHVLRVQCLAIARVGAAQARDMLQEIWEWMFGKRKGPILAFFDEIDTISRDRGYNEREQAAATVTGWTMALLKEMQDVQLRCLLIGLTNYVHLCDPTIRTDFSYRIFFPPPSERTIARMLEMGEIPEAEETAACYINHCRPDAVPLHRTIANGLREMKRIGKTSAHDGPEEVATRLRACATPEDKAQIDEWEAKNRHQITQAQYQRTLFEERAHRQRGEHQAGGAMAALGPTSKTRGRNPRGAQQAEEPREGVATPRRATSRGGGRQ